MWRKHAATILIAFMAAAAPAWGGDDEGIARLATCQDSWLDWQAGNPAPLKTLAGHLQSDFAPAEGKPYLVPKTAESILGLPVSQVYPQSVGMGVGFSVAVDAAFDRTRRALEARLGKSLGKCETGDNMRSCELEIAAKRTVMVMAADDPKSATTLLGCYYYYEK